MFEAYGEAGFEEMDCGGKHRRRGVEIINKLIN